MKSVNFMRKELMIIQAKIKVQSWTTSVILGIIFTFMACSKDSVSTEEPTKEPPSLKVVNQVTDNRYISTVELIGYEFNNLNIVSDSSQTFVLDSGMAGGYENINIIVSYRTSTTPTNSKNTTVNFENGEITTITLKGCISYEGCEGYFLE